MNRTATKTKPTETIPELRAFKKAAVDLAGEIACGTVNLDGVEDDERIDLMDQIVALVEPILAGDAGHDAREYLRKRLALSLLQGRSQVALLQFCGCCSLAEVLPVHLPEGMWQITECPACSE